MTMRLSNNVYQAPPEAIRALGALETLLQDSGLEPSLIELVKNHASQINGCTFCVNMSIEESREPGKAEPRLHSLDAWREAPFYTDRERSALAWTEGVTLVRETLALDDVYDEVRKHFSEVETMNLAMLIATVNVWNWLAVSFRVVPPTRSTVVTPLDHFDRPY
jgi:AhpD family alkylhydroperoxidase